MRREQNPFEGLRDVLTSLGHRFDTELVAIADVSDVVAELALPEDLVRVYLTSDPAPGSSVPWVVEELRVFSVRELSAAQEGYRWTGKDRHALPSWPPHWVTVASVFGDPFIADVSDPSAPIFFARHGMGEWDAVPIATSMSTFIDALAHFEEVLIGHFNRSIWDDAGPRPEFLRALVASLAGTLSPGEAENFLEAVAG